ncbi:MAG: threonine--tRNA ligase [Myxococcota bacterium]
MSELALPARFAPVALGVLHGARWIDLRAPLPAGELELVVEADPRGGEVIRHSAEHLLADAVQRLFPSARLDAGRAEHSEKFQYDFELVDRLSNEQLVAIEAEMRRLAEADLPFVREVVSRDEARAVLEARGERLKLQRLADIPEGEEISLFRHGDFVDLCRGPHVQRSGQVRAIALLEVSGAYLRGDEAGPMLQRVSGVAFADEAALAQWRRQREEAERRDHRKLGRALDLFSIQEEVGGGLVLWHPKGALVRKLMEDWWRDAHLARGYSFVFSPHVGKADLWRQSGHLDFYRDSMFPGMELENGAYFAKPMNCPFHMMIYRSRRRSHRELPLRFAELGAVYRYERSGVLHGLMRVRGFSQDDAHLFCAPEQVEDEIVDAVSFALSLLRAFGFDDFRVCISGRPAEYVGSLEGWESALGSLRRAAERLGLAYDFDEGGGAFYGPKIDVQIRDAIGRLWQCSTVQFDFNLPERFDLSYVGADNQPHRPVVVHRALFGSLERFFGVLLEHSAGALPAWLAPEQCRVACVNERASGFGREVIAALRGRGVRAELDDSGDSLGHKVRAAQLEKIPLVAIIGEQEVARRSVSLRRRSGEKLGEESLEAFLARVEREFAPPKVG